MMVILWSVIVAYFIVGAIYAACLFAQTTLKEDPSIVIFICCMFSWPFFMLAFAIGGLHRQERNPIYDVEKYDGYESGWEER